MTVKLQAVSGMQGFENKSLEELRWEDYQRGNKTATGGGTSFSTPGS